MYRLLLITLLLLIGIQPATAQPRTGQILTPSNTIGNDFMYEAEDGAIWISSLSGWYRSYGGSYELIGPQKDANGGFDPYVQSTLYPDWEGNLWYTGYTSLYRIDAKDESVEAFAMEFPGSEVSNDSYHLLHLDRERKKIWLKVNNRLGMFDAEKEEFQLISPEVKSLRFNVDTLRNGTVAAIIGCIWNQGYGIEYLTPSSNGGLWKYKHFSFEDEFRELRIMSAAWLNESEILLASGSTGLFVFNPQTGVLKALKEILYQKLPTGRTLRFVDDKKNKRLLFSESTKGVWALHYGPEKRAKDLVPEFLHSANIDFFHYSSSGQFWGSIPPLEDDEEEVSPGTILFPGKSVEMVTPPDGLPSYCLSLGGDAKKQLVLGGKGDLHLKSSSSPWRYQRRLSITGEPLRLAEGNDAAFLLSRDSVFVFPLADSTMQDAFSTGTNGNSIFAVHENGNVLTAGNSGLRMWHRDSGETYTYTLPAGFNQTEDLRHKVDYLNYLGNDQLALVENTPRLDIYQWSVDTLALQCSFEIGQDITAVERVYPNLSEWWVGTTAGFFLQTEKELIPVENLRPGRERVSVQSISPIDSVSVFIGTTNGLVYYNHDTKVSRILGKIDGLPGDYFRQGMAIRTVENEHWFITNGGSFGVRPQDVLNYNIEAPEAFLRAYWVSGLKQDVPLAGRKLDYRKNNLAFSLENKTFDYPALTQIKLRVPAINEDWIWVDNGGSVVYSDLEGGDYMLEIQGVSKNGEAGLIKKYSFSIDFPFYRQWWFPWSIVAGGLFVYLIIQRERNKKLRAAVQEQSRLYEEAQKERKIAEKERLIAQQAEELRKKELEKEKEVKKIRKHIHKDVHDSISGEFGCIHAIISRYQDEVKLGVPGASYDLSQIDSHSLRGMDEANEMIDVYNDKELIHQSPIKRLVKIIEHRRKSYGLQAKINIDPELPELYYPVIEVRHMAMIIKEGMENIRKYAQNADLIELILEQEAGKLSIYLKDNGIGIGKGTKPKSIYSRGNGMKNMLERATSLNGEINVSLRPEGGTCLHLSIPLKTTN